MEIRKEDTQKEQLSLYRGRFRARKKVIIFSSLISYFILGYLISNTYAQSSVAPSCQTTGNIIKAASGKPGDLRHAIDKAQSGDTVLIPVGTFTFNDKITIKKGIYLKGAGKDKTVLRRTSGSTPQYEGMIQFDCSSGMRVTVSDLTMRGFGNGTRGTSHSGLGLADCQDFNVYNSKFERFFTAGIRVTGPFARGVIHHNEFIHNYMASGSGPTYGYGIGVNALSDELWKRNLELGTVNTVYIEDNYFEGNKHGITGGRGGKYVARYNTVGDSSNGLWQFDLHGNFNCNNSDAGGRAVEIYENNVNAKKSNSIGIRGGSGVIFNNKLDGNINLYNDCNDSNRIQDLYIWNNSKQSLTSKPSGVSINPKPGYTPYTYPHPLTSCNGANNPATLLPPPRLRVSKAPFATR